jgi:hypothetical protein
MNPALVCLIALTGASSLFFTAHFMLESVAPTGVAPSPPAQSVAKVPQGVILVKGASSSASDSTTPLPEGAGINGNALVDPYFHMRLPLPNGWVEKYQGPPPSDSGRYVLADLTATDSAAGHARGSILITAEDMFFSPLPVTSASELVDYEKDRLQQDYRIEHPPRQLRLGGRLFSAFAYQAPAARLHFMLLATQSRCHTIELALTSRDTSWIDSALRDLDRIELPGEENTATAVPFPVCIKDFAAGANVLLRVDPVFTAHRFNPVPVRIVIDRKGAVRHIHFLSAFPDQARAISEALSQWRFKPCLLDGKAVEVETGILFGTSR